MPSSLYPAVIERRYSDYPRRWLVEYFLDDRAMVALAKGSCATLQSGRKHANNACDTGFAYAARIFDRKVGAYKYTYKRSANGVLRHEGFVK